LWIRDYLTKTVFDTFDVFFVTYDTNNTCAQQIFVGENRLACRTKWSLGLNGGNEEASVSISLFSRSFVRK